MKANKKLLPGQPGIKKLLDKYGDVLDLGLERRIINDKKKKSK